MASEKSLTPWGERIMAWLDGRSRTGLAKEADLSERTLGDIIHKTTPAADKAVKIAQAMGTTVEYLMTGQGKTPSTVPSVAEPTTEFGQPSDAAIRSISDRYRQALLAYEEATQAAAVIPDEALKEVLISLLFRHNIPIEDIVLILAAKARKAT